jgi:hypothetical protein
MTMMIPDVFCLIFVLSLSVAVVLMIICCIIRCIQIRREAEERDAAELAHQMAVAESWRLAEEERQLRLAAAAVKKKLGYFRYSTAVEAGRERQLECVICLEAFVDGVKCSEVPACRHLFHQECIEKSMRRTSTCPLCRADIEPLSAAEDMV